MPPCATFQCDVRENGPHIGITESEVRAKTEATFRTDLQDVIPETILLEATNGMTTFFRATDEQPHRYRRR